MARIPALLATKIGMTRIPDEHGDMHPVTVVKAGPCVVLQVKTKDHDGYDAVQLGMGDVKPHRSTMPEIGHCAKAGVGPKRHVREVRLSENSGFAAGEVVTVDNLVDGDLGFVDVAGISKGKGFQGVMRRHGFGGQPATHGTERKHRSPGGIGGGAQRGYGRAIKKGKRMSGHMGDVRVTMSNLRLMKSDAENDLLLIRGSIPGANGTLVVVQRAVKKGK